MTAALLALIGLTCLWLAAELFAAEWHRFMKQFRKYDSAIDISIDISTVPKRKP